MIFVECDPDEALVRFVSGLGRKQVNHESGRNEICNRLRKQTNCVGMIDEDPGKTEHPYLKKLQVTQDLPEDGLMIKSHQSSGNYLIILRPSFEGWILGAANQTGIDVKKKYDLPKEVNGLHRVINLNLDKLPRLLEDLKDSPRMKQLRRLIQEYHST